MPGQHAEVQCSADMFTPGMHHRSAYVRPAQNLCHRFVAAGSSLARSGLVRVDLPDLARNAGPHF